MPTYDYTCRSCGKKEEIFQKITDATLTTCNHCGQLTLQRGPGGGIGVAFKGNGFYATDYAAKPLPQASSEPKSSGCCPCGKNKGSCSSS